MGKKLKYGKADPGGIGLRIPRGKKAEGALGARRWSLDSGAQPLDARLALGLVG